MKQPEIDNLAVPWWKERMVWLIVALPLSAVIAGITTVFIAAHDPDPMVRSGYSKSGMAVEAVQAPQKQAAALGLAANVRYRDGVLQLALKGKALPDEALTLTMAHPTREELDLQIPLTRLGPGNYNARIELTGKGKRLLMLTPGNHQWQLDGEWNAPFQEETRLFAGAQYPHTHP